MLQLKQANASLRQDLKTLNFPFLKVFHVSHMLSNPISHYQGYNKDKYNGLTILILKTGTQYTALFTRCVKGDTYNKHLGTNYVLKNLVALVRNKAIVDCVNFDYDSTYVEFSERELVRQALYHIRKLSIKKTIPTFSDLNASQVKTTIKNLTEELENGQHKIIFSYKPLLRIKPFSLYKNKVEVRGTRAVNALLVDRKTKEVITSAIAFKNPKDKDNRQIGRIYALLKLKKEIELLMNTGKLK